MNARKKDKDSGGSRFVKNALFRIIEHVHNPFSSNSEKSYGIEAYSRDENTRRELATTSFEAEISKIEASIVAQNMIARFQKS